MSQPTVDLIDHTPYPLETMYSFWHASRTDAPTLTAQEIRGAYSSSMRGYDVAPRFWVGAAVRAERFHEYFDREIMKIAALDFPLKETIIFSFVFSDVTITWREQAVRQRRATPWSQTSRTRPLEDFCDRGWFELPESIATDVVTADAAHSVLLSIQDFYRLALSRNHTREDARCLQPTCQTHRISFAYNARVLEQTMEDRLCFIAQQELWGPIIQQMLAHVVRVDPRLAILFHPPCVKGGTYRYCPVEHENERRMDGRDPYGPCPLWALHEGVQWKDIPEQANAERQYMLVSPLWPEHIRTPVDTFLDNEGRLVPMLRRDLGVAT
jgi:hypothetical protein